MNKKFVIFSAVTLLLFPIISFAYTPPLDVNLILNNIINLLWKIFFGLSIIMFIWAGILFLMGGSNSSKISEAKNVVVWASVGICIAIIGFSIERIIKAILAIT